MSITKALALVGMALWFIVAVLGVADAISNDEVTDGYIAACTLMLVALTINVVFGEE